jgi:hypothetical protein
VLGEPDGLAESVPQTDTDGERVTVVDTVIDGVVLGEPVVVAESVSAATVPVAELLGVAVHDAVPDTERELVGVGDCDGERDCVEQPLAVAVAVADADVRADAELHAEPVTVAVAHAEPELVGELERVIELHAVCVGDAVLVIDDDAHAESVTVGDSVAECVPEPHAVAVALTPALALCVADAVAAGEDVAVDEPDAEPVVAVAEGVPRADADAEPDAEALAVAVAVVVLDAVPVEDAEAVAVGELHTPTPVSKTQALPTPQTVSLFSAVQRKRA